MRNETSKVIHLAKETYYLKLGYKLVDPKLGMKAYWAVLNRLINKKKTLSIPPLLENGLFITNVQAKANLLNDFFVEQCCAIPTQSTLPIFIPRCNPTLQDVPVDREKVLRLIRSLDQGEAHGCDDISIAMIKICDDSIVDPLRLIFERCHKTRIYPYA